MNILQYRDLNGHVSRVTECDVVCLSMLVSNSQVIGSEDRLRNDLYCFGWGV